MKNLFFGSSQYSEGNTCFGVSFLIKLKVRERKREREREREKERETDRERGRERQRETESTTKQMKVSVKDFFSKYGQIRSFLGT